jgi:hypothetical protein
MTARSPDPIVVIVRQVLAEMPPEAKPTPLQLTQLAVERAMPAVKLAAWCASVDLLRDRSRA